MKISQSNKSMTEPYDFARPMPNETELELSPSILSADFSSLKTAIRDLRRCGCRWVHCDVMDNHFVPNLTFGAPVIKALKHAMPEMFYDVHIMITEPEKWVDNFIKAGANCIVFHTEACATIKQTLSAIKRAGVLAGLSIKPNTPVSALLPYLSQVDMILIMTVEPGFGGQGMLQPCIDKIRELAAIRAKKKLNFAIEVDGGVNAQTIALPVKAGADVLVAGSAVFNDKATIAQNIKALKKALKCQSRQLRVHFKTNSNNRKDSHSK